jgi:LysR family transcriptional regulator for bpeEF and oprC
MNRLLAMKIFVRVVDTGSFVKAALTMRVAGSSASRLISLLELHLGVPLLRRNTSAISLTEEGIAHYERCIRVIDDINEMKAEMKKSRRSPTGNLRISLPATVANNARIPALAEFFSLYPDLKIYLLA